MQQQPIPVHVIERLEREWRMMEADRKPKDIDEKSENQQPLKRLKVGRVD
ncbi:hypothetical protein SAMN05880593_12449 [Rhizobium sp. RU36D]|nr:hypothetical protein SAMN05880593_12449 [Rhizobium sp. RU36D]